MFWCFHTWNHPCGTPWCTAPGLCFSETGIDKPLWDAAEFRSHQLPANAKHFCTANLVYFDLPDKKAFRLNLHRLKIKNQGILAFLANLLLFLATSWLLGPRSRLMKRLMLLKPNSPSPWCLRRRMDVFIQEALLEPQSLLLQTCSLFSCYSFHVSSLLDVWRALCCFLLLTVSPAVAVWFVSQKSF